MPNQAYGIKCLANCFIGFVLVVILTVANLDRIPIDFSVDTPTLRLKRDWDFTTGGDDNGLENYGGFHRRYRRESGDTVEKTLQLLAEGDSLIEMSNQTDIILVIGNTGSGKSTLVQFLAGDNDKLESYKKSGTYLIRDLGGKISTKTTISKSIFPELVIQNETNQAFYDCPGFSDTRNQQPYIEIGNSFFIKKVAEHGTRIKIILVVNIFSLQANADRNDFPSLLKQVTILIKDVAKFEKGIALVATKVKSSDTDEEEIENIASFLNDLREELPETLPENQIAPALKLLDAILTKKDGEYNRIGLFRAPREAGFLSEIPKVQENKHNLLQIIHHEIEFVNKTENDFGYALSPTAIILINDLVISINRNISVGLQTISDRIEEEFLQDLQSILTNPGTESGELLERLAKLVVGAKAQSNSNSTEPVKVSSTLKNIIEKIREFGGSTAEHQKDLENLVNQGHYLDFLQNAREDQTLAIESDRWFMPMQNLAKTLIAYLASNLTQSLHTRLFESLETVSRQMMDNYIENEISLTKLITNLDNLKNKTEFEGMRLGEFVRKIMFSLKYSAGSESIIANESKIFDRINTLENIGRIIPKELQLKWEPLKWFQPLDAAIKRIEDEKAWKEFLIDLMQELSEAKIQVKNEGGLKDFQLNQNNNQFNATFVDKFLSTNSVKAKGRERVQKFFSNVRRGAIRIGTLKELLTTTLPRNFYCIRDQSNNLTTIRGRYVVLSSALSCVQPGTSTLLILASHTVFIDKDILLATVNSADTLGVVIIAPNWKIIGSRLIDLNGTNAKDFSGGSPSKAGLGWTGIAGQPGKPGKNGGHFFGIGQRFDGDSNLKVYTSGGNGGSGQPGGEGGDGSKGNDGYMMGVEHSDPGWMYDEGASCWSDGRSRVNQSPYGVSKVGPGRDKDTTNFLYHGSGGTTGYIGGSGGKGGQGGYVGTYRLLPIENRQEVVIPADASIGRSGPNGSGGSGGCHGLNGNAISVDLFAKYCVGCAAYRCKFRNKRIVSPTWCSKGRASSGANGGNPGGERVPSNQEEFEKSLGKFINAFKELAFSEASNNFMNASISKFILELDAKASSYVSNQKLDMYNELITLEKVFASTLKNKNNLIPFYESLLKRTYQKGVNLNGEAYKANSILYGATLSKLCSLKTPLEPYLIVDIKNYFEMAKRTAQKFQTQWTNQQRLEIVEQSKNEYTTQIDEKFSEAQELITNVINPEIEKIHTRIQNNIQRLVREIEELRKQKLQETIELERKEEELRTQMRLDAIFGFLKMGAQLVGCMGPFGAAAGSVVGAGIGMGEQFATPGSSTETKIVALPAAIQNLQSDLSTQYGKYAKSKLDAFQLQITDTERLLESDDNAVPVDGKAGTSKPKPTNALKTKIGDINSKIKAEQRKIALLSKVDKTKLSADSLKALTDSESMIAESKKELKTLLKESEVSLKKEAKKTAKIQNTLEKVGQATQIVSMGTEIYAKYRGSQNQLAIINEQIEKSKQEEKQIEEHKQNVFKVMIPTIRNMRQNMDSFQSSLGSRSGVSLEVGKWQVTSALKEIRSQIKLFTEGFPADLDMMRCFEMLEEAMTTLINVYDRLQSYGDQAKLVKFISAANSAAFVNLAVSDPELKKVIQELEIVIQANILIQQYESALDSFKMWVFPFGNLYMTELSQLPSLSSARDTQGLKNMASIVAKNIDKLSEKLNKYRTSIVSYDQRLHFRNFGEPSGGDSFHVWKNSEYSTEIRKLLSGEKVVLKAAVSNCPSGMNAIKFRKLDLKFKVLGNSSGDEQLTNALEGYKVVLTHGGNSYYTYERSVVVISSKKITFSFSFSKHSRDGLPNDRNAVYDKLRTGDLVLSPYTVWEIQLFPMAGSDFRRLVPFANMKIDLKLNGEGTYVIDKIAS